MSSLYRHRGRTVNPLPEANNPRQKSQSLLKRFRRKGHQIRSDRLGNLSDPTRAKSRDETLSRSLFSKISTRSINNSTRTVRRRSTVTTASSSDESRNYMKRMSNSTQGSFLTDTNVMIWLEKFCPDDIVPKILAYAGPQQTARLSKTNKHWNNFIKQERTWRVMCEELYKWEEGDEEPESWQDHYRFSPCVPVDYSSVHSALKVASGTPCSGRRSFISSSQVRGVRILLRPGKYYLNHSIDISAISGAMVTMQTICPPGNSFPSSITSNLSHLGRHQRTSIRHSTTTKRNSIKTIRSLMRCVRPQSEVISDTEEDVTEVGGMDLTIEALNSPKTATLVLRSRRHNEPVFRVQQGVLHLLDVEIQHHSFGMDIWNGNAAVQIQPPLGDDDIPVTTGPRPSAILDRVQVTSRTGRGIVNIDGGSIIVRDCMVRDCAATGIYIGGPGSQAFIQRTDVLRNGVGNPGARRGVGRGHSGIYLEQGFTKIVDSNISYNTLTGVSVVSQDNSIISLEDSDLMSNGTFQLELPPVGSVARQACIAKNNQLSDSGVPRLRSGLTASERDITLQSTSDINILLG